MIQGPTQHHHGGRRHHPYCRNRHVIPAPRWCYIARVTMVYDVGKTVRLKRLPRRSAWGLGFLSSRPISWRQCEFQSTGKWFQLKESDISKVPLKGGHFIKQELGAFDAPFFSISASEAEAMDPQSRALLETTYRALENGNYFLHTE